MFYILFSLQSYIALMKWVISSLRKISGIYISTGLIC